MIKKYILAALALGFSVSAKVMAQVPSYVPTNGLVGYWPFNGNANDESGNGNNGTVNGATLTTDRYGNINKAYSFNASNQRIQTNYPGILGQNARSISLWYLSNTNEGGLLYYGLTSPGARMNIYLYPTPSGHSPTIDNSNSQVAHNPTTTIGTWNHLVITYQPSYGTATSSFKFYINGALSTGQFFNYNGNQSFNTQLGDMMWFGGGPGQDLIGKLDDIGMWNRALSDQEITDLYNATVCANNLTITPNSNALQIGNTASFNATTSDANATINWQSDFGQGFQTLNNYGSYSGTNSNSLSISNVQLANHNQPIRAISTSGNCLDTSNIAIIQITDTCITNVTVYDTLLTTVTDTLVINTNLGLPAPNNENTILIYPNPASDHITIDNGNYTSMAGYSLKIENNAGQQVFQSLINQAQFFVDLSAWTGDGLYFLHLFDPQGNTVTVRKIVLQ
jgi:hypothetical protein